MNRLERRIHEALEHYPGIRRWIRDLYQRSCSLMPQKNIVAGRLIARPGYFYGFHTTNPWSHDNKLLLTHRYMGDQFSKPHSTDSVEVGYFSGEDFMHYTPLAETRSWNWQQGSMLQWLGNTHRLVFNDFDGLQNCTRILDSDGVQIKSLDRPISAVSNDGKTALSYSFGRLKTGMPGYEYANGIEEEVDSLAPARDGLFRIDLESGAATMIFSLAEIADHEPMASFRNSYHFFSHCLFSPSGDRFLFFHRWLTPSGVIKTRMISSDSQGRDLYIFPTNDFVSHVCWLSDSRVLAFAETPQHGRGYYLFCDKSSESLKIGQDFFKSDGHPCISRKHKQMVTDTYPDRYRMQRLLMYDPEQAYGRELLRLRIPFRFRNEVRCDFHPRWDRSGRFISLDSAHSGMRAHCTLEVQL